MRPRTMQTCHLKKWSPLDVPRTRSLLARFLLLNRYECLHTLVDSSQLEVRGAQVLSATVHCSHSLTSYCTRPPVSVDDVYPFRTTFHGSIIASSYPQITSANAQAPTSYLQRIHGGRQSQCSGKAEHRSRGVPGLPQI